MLRLSENVAERQRGRRIEKATHRDRHTERQTDRDRVVARQAISAFWYRSLTHPFS